MATSKSMSNRERDEEMLQVLQQTVLCCRRLQRNLSSCFAAGGETRDRFEREVGLNSISNSVVAFARYLRIPLPDSFGDCNGGSLNEAELLSCLQHIEQRALVLSERLSRRLGGMIGQFKS